MIQVRSSRTVLVAAALGLIGNLAVAQNRMPPIPADKVTAEQKESVKEFQAVRGREPFGPFVPLMRSPDLMVRASAMGEYLRYRTSLTPRLSEFVILLTAREWSQQYEWNVHHPEAMKAGVDPKIAQAIADGRRPDGMSDDETLLYDFFMELQRNRSISDPTYARMVARFGEKGVMDTIGVVGYYSLLGMVLNTARTPPTPGAAPPLPMLPK
jgi:4-carboxymuconolactone decarboxylase